MSHEYKNKILDQTNLKLYDNFRKTWAKISYKII